MDNQRDPPGAASAPRIRRLCPGPTETDPVIEPPNTPLIDAAAAALAKKYTVAVFATANFELSANAFAIAACHCFRCLLHVRCQPDQVCGAYDNAASSFAAVAAHAAVENRFSVSGRHGL